MLVPVALALYLLDRGPALRVRIAAAPPPGWEAFLRRHCFPEIVGFAEQDLWCSARLRGRLVGLSSLHRHPDHWLLSNSCVDPRHRRRGISTAMMRAQLDRAQALRGRGPGRGKIRIYVKDNNAAALATVAKFPELVHTHSTTRYRAEGLVRVFEC